MLCSSFPPLFFFLLLPSVLSFPLFPSDNLTLYGDAFFSHKAITLTTHQASCSSSSIGRAFFIYPLRFLDPQTNSTASFISRFSFSILSSPSCPSGEGLAFLIASSTHFPALSMGLPQPSPNSTSFFAVEFDTTFDPSLGDINDNHVALDVNSASSFASVDTFSRGIDLKSGKLITAWVEYRHAIKMVSVWLAYSSTRPSTPILVSQIDLSERLQDFMHVGFTASNGKGSSDYLVHHWQFTTFGHDSRSMDVIDEGDCFLCYEGDSTDFGHGSNMRVNERKKKIKEMALGLGGLTAFMVSVLAAMIVVCVFLTRKKGVVRKNMEQRQSCGSQTSKVPTRLSLSEIKSATMGFNRDRLVGEGASAKVYKGYLPFGGDVAVKRFQRQKDLNCLHNPFATEFATMVGCLRHKNLVQLKGWCCEGKELVLVYEFLPNGSLNKVLHRNFNSSIVLSWRQRENIVLGVAAALTYLHEECERQIIHRDVKSCNIMLDADFNAKLGDFGLAEVYEHSCSRREATIPAGTMGYLAPEYVYSGVPTVKSDVYSFGVVVLEVGSGRKPVEDDGSVVVDYVWSLWEKGKLIEGADPRLMGKFDAVDMERMLLVGLLCVHPDHEKRPTVREAARMLNKEAPLPVLPPVKPRLRIRPISPQTHHVLGDCLSTDEPPYFTPRSHFY
ncbi:L-type lectin-domain containing receptor kinase S.6 [Vigna angularis]|uniref:L-type lectin-domain containing receptor kinase S.6 n=1 Tax=Phaseolus angularis TaxID=3914 RepID=UPI000809FFB1|nr:L-type lectin-domain containing receptor kinase S.6 [Vigna angularis]